MTWLVGEGPSKCGLHPGYMPAHLCPGCSRAHAANEDALRNVTPKTAHRHRARTPDARVAEVRERYAAGSSIATIAHDLSMPCGTVSNLVHGTRCTTDPAVTRATLKRQHNAMMPIPGSKAYREALPLSRG
jgi:hypothetical protein